MGESGTSWTVLRQLYTQKVHVEYNNVIILRELPNQTFMSNITS